VVIILFYVMVVAATNGSLICPEMAVRVLCNIALYHRYAMKTDCLSWQQSVQSRVMSVGRSIHTAPVLSLTGG
jgi:hypothetical protein